MSNFDLKKYIDNFDEIEDVNTKNSIEQIQEFYSIVFPNNFEKKYNKFIKIWHI